MSLVGSWPLISVDGSGVTPDISGNGFNGLLKPTYSSDCPTSISGPCPANSGALLFDGSNDYIDVSTATLADGNVWSVAAWIKPDDLARRTIWGGGNQVFGTSQNLDGGLEVIRPGSVIDISVAGAVTAGRWWFVAYSRSGQADANSSFYVNAAKVGKSVHYDTSMGSTGSAKIGCYLPGTRHWKGGIGGVKFFNHALDHAEVYRLYQVALAENSWLTGGV